MYTLARTLPLALLASFPGTAAAAPAQESRAFRRIVDERGFARVSPFRGMRRSAGRIEVQVDGDTWFELVSVDRVSARELWRGAREHCGDRAWERIVEDIVEVLDVLGARPGATVDLELRDLATGKRVTRKGVVLNRAKRRRAKRLAQARGRGRRAAEARAPATLGEAAWRADLAQLAELLDRRFSYRRLGDVDLEDELAAAAERLGGGSVTRARFGQEVARVIAAFRDGHAGVVEDVFAPGYLPFLVGHAGGRPIAFRADRSGLVDPDRPWLVALDGRPVARWLEAARPFVNRGSPQYVAERGRRMLRRVQFLRGRLGIEQSDELEVELDGPGGARVVKVRVAARRPVYGEWPRTESRVLEGGVGYLRIARMSDEPAFLDRLDGTMQRLADTRGLVIDVRGNGGGSRAVLRRLFPYFMPPGERARVANVAAYRLQPGRDDPHRAEGYLQNRWLYPANWPGWSDAARAAIARCAKRFRPEWRPPSREFSGWHYLVLERDASDRAFHYDEPVAILMDSVCFSATDVFLGAFEDRPGVTLVGTPSGGGSGRSAGYRLENSGLRLRLSTMASFRPNGELYDGNGIEPDVRVEPRPTDWIGETDTVLDAAVELLREAKGK